MENEKRGALALENDRLTVTSVSKVISSGDKSIVLMQNKETLTITGEGLSVTEINLDSGRLSATGRVKEIRFRKRSRRRDLSKRFSNDALDNFRKFYLSFDDSLRNDVGRALRLSLRIATRREEEVFRVLIRRYFCGGNARNAVFRA